MLDDPFLPRIFTVPWFVEPGTHKGPTSPNLTPCHYMSNLPAPSHGHRAGIWGGGLPKCSGTGMWGCVAGPLWVPSGLSHGCGLCTHHRDCRTDVASRVPSGLSHGCGLCTHHRDCRTDVASARTIGTVARMWPLPIPPPHTLHIKHRLFLSCTLSRSS